MTLEAWKILTAISIALAVYLGLINDPRAKETTFKIYINVIIKDTTQMPFGLDEIGAGLFSTGLGMIGQKWAQDQDYRNQLRLMQRQQQLGQENAVFNQGLALDLWRQTNYPAQVDMMRKAGLNPGLMYKGAGPGGTTGPVGGNQPTTSAPPRYDPGMALQIGLQTAMQQAQIENIKADTKVKEASAPKTQAETARITADTQNLHLDNVLKQFDVQLKQITTNIAEATKPDAISTIKANAEKVIQEAYTAGIESRVAKETAKEKIEQVSLATTEAALRIELQKANLIKTGTETTQIESSIREIAARINNLDIVQKQRWNELSLEAQNTGVRQLLAELQQQQITFNTSTPEQLKQWLSALLAGANVAGGLKRPRP